MLIDAGKANARDLGEDRVHLFERAGGKVGVACDIADQVFETNAGVVVKEIFDAVRRDARKLAMVAMGGANDKDDAIASHRSSPPGTSPPSQFAIERFLHRERADILGARPSGLIAPSDLASVAALPTNSPNPMPLHFGKIGAAIALLTVAAFVLWLIFTTFFATEQADQQIERTGAVAFGASQAS